MLYYNSICQFITIYIIDYIWIELCFASNVFKFIVASTSSIKNNYCDTDVVSLGDVFLLSCSFDHG